MEAPNKPDQLDLIPNGVIIVLGGLRDRTEDEERALHHRPGQRRERHRVQLQSSSTGERGVQHGAVRDQLVLHQLVQSRELEHARRTVVARGRQADRSCPFWPSVFGAVRPRGAEERRGVPDARGGEGGRRRRRVRRGKASRDESLQRGSVRSHDHVVQQPLDTGGGPPAAR